MSSLYNRESLRAELRGWSERERRIVVERLVEHLPDTCVEMLLEGLVYLDDHVITTESEPPPLRERIERHVRATRSGEFRGEYELRNAHGQREPWQTEAWVAATGHLFELALAQARPGADEDARENVRALVALAREVDERTDELVVFEEAGAWLAVGHGLERAKKLLDGGSSAGQAR